MEHTSDKIRTDCWNSLLDSIALAYIYQKKIVKTNVWLRISKILGIIIPVFLGGVLTSAFNTDIILNWAIWITSPFALGQLVLSTFLTIDGSEEKVSKYSTKSAEYSLLASDFRLMAKYPIPDTFEYKKKFELLVERENGISKGDIEVTDSEKRMGMRFGLRDLGRACAGCQKVPTSMKPTNCDVCGNF